MKINLYKILLFAFFLICQNISAQDCTISSFNPDSDGDSISDRCDLDDDNDGILDTNECPENVVPFFYYYNSDDYSPNIYRNIISSALPSTIGSGLTRKRDTVYNYMELSGINATSESGSITNNEYVEYVFTTKVQAFIKQVGYYATNSSSLGSFENTQYHFSVRISPNDDFSDSEVLLADRSYDASTGTFLISIKNGSYLVKPNIAYKVRVYFFSVNGGSTATIAHDDFTISGTVECDTDGDGIPNRIDLDSDNDGCVDAIEGTDNITSQNLKIASGTLNTQNPNKNFGTFVDTKGISYSVKSTGQGVGESQDPNINNCPPEICFNTPNTTGTGKDTQVGISLLRADDLDNWPYVRKSGFMALESNNKGMVVTRIEKVNLPKILSPQEGMIIYDTTDKCLKIYSDGNWKCFNNPSCP